MSIRLDHVHPDGKQCFVTRSRHPLEEKGRFMLGSAVVSAAYMPYTGSYYAWDDDGRQVAQFDRDFFRAYVKPHQIGTFQPDPDCEPVHA